MKDKDFVAGLKDGKPTQFKYQQWLFHGWNPEEAKCIIMEMRLWQLLYEAAG